MMENHEMKIEVKEENHEVKIDVNVENHDMKTEEKENHEMKTEEKESHDMKTEEKESHEMKTEEENHEMKTEIKTEETQEIKMEVEDHHEMKIEVKEEEYEEVKVEKHQDQEADLHPLNTNRTDPASSSGPSDLQRTMAGTRVTWSQSTEEQLVELWRAHPSLFDVGSQSYHNRTKREKSWGEIANQLQLPVNEVKTRVASLRTQYGKLLKPKPSGRGQRPLTPKQKWILKHLDFLKGHVIHRTTESTLRPGTESEDTCEGEENPSTVEREADVLSSSDSTSPVSVVQEEESSPPVTCQPVQKQRVKKQKPQSAQPSLEMVKLSLLQQIQKTLSSTADPAELFGQQVATEIRIIEDKAVYARLKRNIMNMIYEAQEAESVCQSAG
ncbi:uncharacterized protein LOC110367769 isoform X9 [Fundulus heteroclitus]|uniref:uncharacterized protein LOC110367769 isoform X9 n=1 Tax=Fundulus heteroclitus TaxID=8078 RepID=UPI00165A3B96|nr:uncharacterized protein LOC110367769 isoform X9 [Fundulus heteroclitus]